MITEETTQNNSEEYKNFEMELHREIMNSCRKYIKKISIFSILGIIDYVKQEVVELENATTQNLKRDPTIDIE
ncbi:hypothetical protein AYK21_02425 [Thermoplasmatales archaeon SG8-52-2]|nr:MAG: hypothetical protein AYK21_02425 [Thermoplasmatales archaeon SG8-52-2]